MTTCLGKSCSFGLPRVPFVNCCLFMYMYLVIALLVLRAGCGIWLYQFLIIAYLFTLPGSTLCVVLIFSMVHVKPHCSIFVNNCNNFSCVRMFSDFTVLQNVLTNGAKTGILGLPKNLKHGHQAISFIAYTNGTKLSVSCFFEIKFRNRAMLNGEILIERLRIAIGF